MFGLDYLGVAGFVGWYCRVWLTCLFGFVYFCCPLGVLVWFDGLGFLSVFPSIAFWCLVFVCFATLVCCVFACYGFGFCISVLVC